MTLSSSSLLVATDYKSSVQAIADILQTANLYSKPAEAVSEAENFVCGVLSTTWSQLKLHPQNPVSAAEIQEMEALLKRRLLGEPLAYLFGIAHFYGLEICVNANVLIPRPETEILVEHALQIIDPLEKVRIVDLGCGSGCIGVTLLKHRPQIKALFIDKSPEALKVTRRNIDAFEFEGRAECLESEISATSPSLYNSEWMSIDMVVANPPYISVDDPRVEKSVQQYEPKMALYGGADGMEWIHKWLSWSYTHLKGGGNGFMEIGIGQSEAVRNQVEQVGLVFVKAVNDYHGIPRVIHFRKDISDG